MPLPDDFYTPAAFSGGSYPAVPQHFDGDGATAEGHTCLLERKAKRSAPVRREALHPILPVIPR
jgi:hypothetical protein